MEMNDDSIVQIMQTLTLNYKPAELATQSFENKIASLNKQLFDMKTNALAYARDINQTFSSQLGNISGANNISNIASQYAKNNVILDQYGNILKKVKPLSEQITNETKKHGQSVKDLANQYNVLGSQLERRVSWFMTGSAFYGAIDAAKQTVTTISQVEMGMTQIARITEDVNFSFEGMREKLLDLGVQYGATFDTVQDIALKWAQAGYNMNDTIELTKNSLLAINTAELNSTQSTQGFIAIMSQWGLTAKDLLPTLDKINKVADDYAVSSQDLVDGLTRASGAAKVMGLDIDQTIAILTTMREASGRTGKEVGNALNSILSYIQRDKSIDIMDSLGINMFADKAKTQFRSVMDIFSELAAKYNDPSVSQGVKDALMAGAEEAGLFSEELANATGMQDEYSKMTQKATEAQGEFNDIEKRDAAQAAAGVYRRNYFIGLLERWTTTQKVLNSVNNSANYSMQENTRTMETLEKKFESLKASAEKLAVEIGEAGLLDSLKGLVDAGTGAINTFNKLDDSTKSLIINMGILYTSIKSIQSIAKMLGIGAGVGIGAKAVSTATTATATAEAGGMMAVLSKIPGYWKIIALAAGAALLTIKSNISATNQRLEEQAKKVGDLGEKYFDLKEKLSHSPFGTSAHDDLQAQLNSVINSISQAEPTYIEAINEHAKVTKIDEEALQEQVKAYEALNDAQKKQLEAQNDINSKLEEIESTRKKAVDAITSENTSLSELATIYERNRSDGKDNIEVEKSIISIIGEKTWATVKGKNDISTAISELIKIRNEELAAIEENARKQKQAERDRLENTVKTLQKELEANVSYLNYLQNAAPIYIKEKRTATNWWQSAVNFVANGLDQPEWTVGELPEDTTGKAISDTKDKLTKAKEELNTLQSEINNDVIEKNSGKKGNNGNKDTKTKAYKNEVLDSYLKWIDYKKDMDILSAEDEIKAYQYAYDNLAKIDDEKMDLEVKIHNARKQFYEDDLNKYYDFIDRKVSRGEWGTEQELNELQWIEKSYTLSAEQRQELEDKIFEKEKQLREDRLNDSKDWLEQEKEYGRLSVEQTIAAYNRILDKQKDNIEAVKYATKGLFDTYKDLLEEQQDSIKDAYDKRVDMIEDEAKLAKEKQQIIIDSIEEKEKALDRSESKSDYEKEMADLKDELAYWSVRTSKEAREKVAEINKQIAEKEHDRDVELKKQEYEDQKDAAQKEIDKIEETANKKKVAIKTAWDSIQSIFTENNNTLIANAETTSKIVAEKYQTIADKIKEVFSNGNITVSDDGTVTVNGAQDIINTAKKSTLNTQVKSLAEQIVALKREYDVNGNLDAAAEATPIYNQLQSLRPSVADALHRMDYDAAMKYINRLPKAHTGAKTLSYGIAKLKPGELIFPPNLSQKIERLIAILGNGQSTNGGSQNHFSGPLFNAEKVYLDDGLDIESVGRELYRAILSIK